MRTVPLSRDFADDTPIEESVDGFLGVDLVSKPTMLAPGMIRAGGNMRADMSLLKTRPGLAYVAAMDRGTLNPGSRAVQGVAYFDTPQIERIITAWNGRLYETPSDAFNSSATEISGPVNGATQYVPFAQLVDRLFYVDGWIKWLFWSGSAWQSGTVSTFSNASAMPFMALLVAHKFRLIAVQQNSDKIWASAIGDAAAPANWFATDSLRIGDGEGDPIVALIPSPAGALYALKRGSVWSIDTAAPTLANWSSENVTRLTGCVAGRTAVPIGQDVFFLSRYGVVSLGALVQDNAISPLSTLSAPVQPYFDQINWAAIDTAWGAVWRDSYVIALPIDGATVPNVLLSYNTLTKTWQTPWYTAMPGRTVAGEAVTMDGFTAAATSAFGERRETILGDSCGRLHRIDEILDKDQPSAAANTDIVSWCCLKAWDFDAAGAPKQPLLVECEWYKGTGRSVTINLIRDAEDVISGDVEEALIIASSVQTSDAIVSNADTNSVQTFPIRFPFTLGAKAVHRLRRTIRELGRFREASLQLICEQGRMQLRAVRMSAFLDNPSLRQ
ncbi:hypothetical protein [Nibricoccus sp. IMCC34717]|uniref:hypothetical protein n=1 Tax=Nibricoccus sp. IMCC34717 TaxID=3034021 RepID=UPI00384BCF2A